jgi:hypothetical protein
MPVSGFIVDDCLDCMLAFIISGVVKQLSLSLSFLACQNFFCTFFACSRNDWGIYIWNIVHVHAIPSPHCD